MKTIRHKATVLDDLGLRANLERAGRLAYKSEDKIKPGSADTFIAGIIKNNHMAVLNMSTIHIKLKVTSQGLENIKPLYLFMPYIVFTAVKEKDNDMYNCLMSASPRAYIEFIKTVSTSFFAEDLASVLYTYDPIVFSPIVNIISNEYAMYSFEIQNSTDAHSYITDYVNSVYNISIEKEKKEAEATYLKHMHKSVHLVTNRAVSHEVVRHSRCSFIQESQRYCRYQDDKFGNEVTFIAPPKDTSTTLYSLWERSCSAAEFMYLNMLENGASPQVARLVLPNSCKTELITHCSIRQWLHVLALRTHKSADPGMVELTTPLLEDPTFNKISIETVRQNLYSEVW